MVKPAVRFHPQRTRAKWLATSSMPEVLRLGAGTYGDQGNLFHRGNIDRRNIIVDRICQ